MQGARAFNLIARNAVRCSRRNYGGSGRKSTMNEMPVPHGDFWAYHAQRQRKYNGMLAIGVTSVSFGLFLAKSTGLINLHYDPPSTYE